MTNIQESAAQLEQAIRESEEFQNLKQAYELVMTNADAKAMFENFRRIQFELQEKQMQGLDITEEEVTRAREIVEQVQKHENITRLMEEEQRVNGVIQLISQVIMRPLDELYGNPDSM
ncbi:UPF0342 protein YheA [Compostibacillus humi]|uniref:UPF0342 protein GCM10010978_11060 n=1 Tax=Compostibacillus humi TaxID=1245525 RepID=A0A8J2ZS09_9BACI|nr:YlbF family regulator [Compostibacillus humi]GGH73308.1 UPF0342 protein YheA [Compostibacillus humi]